ncbi:MAG: hypothetical protein QXT27_06540 [Pyrobaculum sp.]
MAEEFIAGYIRKAFETTKPDDPAAMLAASLLFREFQTVIPQPKEVNSYENGFALIYDCFAIYVDMKKRRIYIGVKPH